MAGADAGCREVHARGRGGFTFVGEDNGLAIGVAHYRSGDEVSGCKRHRGDDRGEARLVRSWPSFTGGGIERQSKVVGGSVEGW